MMPDLMLAEMSEPFEIFLDYEMPTTSSVQLADAKESAEMIKTASWPSMLLRRYETIKIEPGKLTILLSERPVCRLGYQRYQGSDTKVDEATRPPSSSS
jgi:hypothetical protein